MTAKQLQRFGFVSVLGLPNVGKSTLVNALVGSKVSIVSKKVQTTRCRILGIAMHDQAQIVLMDTPGIFSPRKMMERAMIGAAWDTLDNADLVLHLVDATHKKAVEANDIIIDKLPAGKRCALVLNKIDKAGKPELLAMADVFSKRFQYDAIFMVSALKSERTNDILSYIESQLPEEPWQFDPEQTTDMPMRFMAAEITREKIFHQLHEELPYSALVETESWENFDNGSVKISQLVYVQKDSQKAIVLGKGGSRIKEIGAAARAEMEEIFGMKVHLKLFVKVQENWTERQESFRLMGLESSG